ncbi:MAG: MBG domain-containing protein [Bacilli bacterium]
MMLAMVPNNGVFAAEPDKFVTSANANHWGRSDLRAYLNNVTKSANTLPINSTTSGSNAAKYPSQFSDAEYGLVQPFTYSTYTTNNTINIFDKDDSPKVTAVYETTDKFWLPSGNSDSNQVISWAAEDISSASQYTMTTATNKQRLIPVSYWSYGASTDSWLRSPFYVTGKDSRDNYYHVLCLTRGFRVWDNYCNWFLGGNVGTAAAFKIDMKDVVFASTASAKAIAAEDGAKKIEISGSLNFGKRTRDSLPDYGMYLKTKSTGNFEPTGLTFDDTNLTVNYTGGVKDQYVVVHAFKEDSLTDGHTSYVAAQKLESGNSSATINVSAWDLSSLDGYTIKVWMEDNSGNLAAATTPYTFVGSDGAISKDINGAGATNSRVFAMKNELQCSWGDLSALSDDDYQRVITLKDVTTDLFGKNPTNQKIYFGADSSGNPLEFWIAGRETYANGGTISSDGNIMTLYQAKSVEIDQFNSAYSEYDHDKPVGILQLEGSRSAEYTGSQTSYPGYPDCSYLYEPFKWQHRKIGTTAWKEEMPTDAGKYEIRCYAEGTDNYERTYSAYVDFTVEKAKITPSITAEDKDYDGNTAATVNVSFEGLQKDEKLVEGKDYTVSATFDDATAGENKTVTATITLKNTAKANNYKLSTDSVKTTAAINKKGITVKAEDKTKIEGDADPELTYTVDGLIEGDSLTGSLERVEGEMAGSYEIKQGTLTEENNSNYEIKFEPGKFTISAKPAEDDPSEEPEKPGNDSETEQPSDRPEWGETMITIKGIKHYISKDGSRSVEISEENTDVNGIIWVKEESYDPYLGYDTAAWYGFDNSNGVFENGSRAYVHWYNKEQNSEKFSDIDETHEVEDNNCYYFEVGVIKPDGTSYAQLSEPIKFYVQIGDDWDREDLEAFYITQGEDEKVPVTFGTENYPEGEDEFGIMTLSHFSPYFIYDKLTDEEKTAFDALSDKEKAQLDAAAKELASQQKEKAAESIKTGDEVTYFTSSGLGLMMTLALGLMINSKLNKKKSDE